MDETTATLRTERLVLRPVAESDVERILEYRNHPDVNRWLIHTEVDPDAYRAACKAAVDDPDDHTMAVVLDGLVIGTVSLELSDGRRLYLMQQPPGGELPAVLQPHDSHQTWAPCHELERAGLDLSEPVFATAKMDSGALLRSPRRRLISRSARRRGPG